MEWKAINYECKKQGFVSFEPTRPTNTGGVGYAIAALEQSAEQYWMLGPVLQSQWTNRPQQIQDYPQPHEDPADAARLSQPSFLICLQ